MMNLTDKLMYVCVRCQIRFLNFKDAHQHELETGHAVELFRENMSQNPIIHLFVERYWYPRLR